MKRILALSLAVLFLFLCACKAEPEFKNGDMLFELGIENLDDIEHCGLWYFDEDTPKAISAKLKDEKDYEFLGGYKVSGDYNQDEIHKLFSIPGCQRITLKSEAGEFLLYVFEDGTIVTQEYKTCTSDNPITFAKLEKLAKEYKLPEFKL